MAVVLGGFLGFVGGYMASAKYMGYNQTPGERQEEGKISDSLLSRYPYDSVDSKELSPETLAREIRAWPSKQVGSRILGGSSCVWHRYILNLLLFCFYLIPTEESSIQAPSSGKWGNGKRELCPHWMCGEFNSIASFLPLFPCSGLALQISTEHRGYKHS